MIEVRRATPADVPRLGDTFARAYLDDPMMTWYVGERADRLARLQRFFTAALGRLVRGSSREVWTTSDVAGGAHWARPGSGPVSPREMLPGVPAVLRSLGPAGMRRSARAYRVLQRHRPAALHLYLEGLATHPDHQRRGVASALVGEMLAHADGDGAGAYLETQRAENVPFYERHGFRVTAEIDVPGSPVHMWQMWRDAQR